MSSLSNNTWPCNYIEDFVWDWPYHPKFVTHVLVWLTERDHYTDTPYTWENNMPPQNVKICQTSKCYICHKSWGSVPLSCWMLGCAIRSPPWRHDNPAGQYSALGCQNMHTVSGKWTRTSPPVACLFSRQVSHRARLASSGLSGTATCPAMSMNSALPFKQSGAILHSCHNRQPGVANAQAMYCTGQRTYQILSCEFRHMTYVLMALFVIVHWISVWKMFELCYIMIHKCILKINQFITCTIMRK